MKKFKIITLFPEFFTSPLNCGLMGKAKDSGIIGFDIINLRDYSQDKFGRCDDYPYGGGSGMVLKPEPLFRCLTEIKNEHTTVILTTPGGVPFNQEKVKDLYNDSNDICIICGHYEGIDHRVTEKFVDMEVSIGDYVLSGGEYAALIIADSIVRYVPGFMSNNMSLEEESFENDLLEYPHYTRPSVYEGESVPEILLSGNHAKIAEWRLEKSIEKTKQVRPDLYKRYLSRNKVGDI